jgi:hypothetical protein
MSEHAEPAFDREAAAATLRAGTNAAVEAAKPGADRRQVEPA